MIWMSYVPTILPSIQMCVAFCVYSPHKLPNDTVVVCSLIELVATALSEILIKRKENHLRAKCMTMTKITY